MFNLPVLTQECQVNLNNLLNGYIFVTALIYDLTNNSMILPLNKLRIKELNLEYVVMYEKNNKQLIS